MVKKIIYLHEWSYTTWMYLFGWILINVGPMWYTIYSNKKSRPDKIRDANYGAFVRLDYDRWSYITALFTHFFFLPRFMLGWLGFFFGCIGCSVMCIGADPFNLPMWRVKILEVIC